MSCSASPQLCTPVVLPVSFGYLHGHLEQVPIAALYFPKSALLCGTPLDALYLFTVLKDTSAGTSPNLDYVLRNEELLTCITLLSIICRQTWDRGGGGQEQHGKALIDVI